ncbi:MAG: hypothetical protein IJB96_06460 [Lachnospira sp.]|nr:hypothetical protein [Lachnospira sp.]
MRCAKQYEAKLLGTRYLIIYREHNNMIKHLEISFGEENYQHLTGIELIDSFGNTKQHVSRLFFKKCLTNKLSIKEIKLKKDGTTNLKLAALPVLLDLHKITKIAGSYNNSRQYLIADKIVGNTNFCLGLKYSSHSKFFVPSSALLEDINNPRTSFGHLYKISK